MAISDTQKVDYLWKKIGYGVAKTDTDANKKAYEEAIASTLLLRGDKLWTQSGLVPGAIPNTSSSITRVYKDGTGSWASTVKATVDSTATLNRTWKTNLTDWIPVEFGPTFQVQVYIDTDASTTPQSTGTKIFAAGSGNNDEWYFDYQAGILNFIGANLPSGLTAGKSVYVAGARYIGAFGVSGSVSSQTADLGNLNITENTISSINPDGNINLTPDGIGTINLNANVTVSGNVTADIVTANSLVTSTIVGGNLTVTSINTADKVIDSFTVSKYRTAKYVIKATSDNGHQAMEVLLIHNNSNSFITIYGAISTIDDDIITLTSNVASGNVKLYATGTGANTVVNLVGTYVTD